MSKLKFTPGPYLREGLTIYALQPNTDWRSGPPEVNRFSAYVQGQRVDGKLPPLEELEVVARLFQASPNLYAALEEIIAECPNPKLPYVVRVVEIARAALAAVEAPNEG